MRRYYMLCLALLLALSAHAQQQLSLMILPQQEGMPFSQAVSDQKVLRPALEALEHELEKLGFAVRPLASQLAVWRRAPWFQDAHAQQQALSEAGTDVVLLLSARFHEHSRGNWLALSVAVQSPQVDSLLYLQSLQSHKMRTSDIEGLARQAWKRQGNALPEVLRKRAWRSLPKKEPPFISDLLADMPAGKRVGPHAVAVVVGVRQYQHAEVPQASYALNDAQTMRTYLQRSMGFAPEQIVYLENPTLSDLNAIFGTWAQPKGRLHQLVKPELSEVFVFFSGQGASDASGRQGFLLPADANPNLLSQTAYPLESLYAGLSQLPYRSLTLMLEASCFSSQLAKVPPQAPAGARADVSKKVLRDPKALVLLPTEPQQQASAYASKKQGLLTYLYLKGMQGAADLDGDRRITVRELDLYLGTQVGEYAVKQYGREQTPQVWGEPEAVLYELPKQR